MNSDERLVARVAKELLEQSAVLAAPIGALQLALSEDTESLSLPAMVITADRQGEEQAVNINGTYGAKYRLTVELRYLASTTDARWADGICAAVDLVLNVAPAVTPPTASQFNQYLIISMDDASRTSGETITRARHFTIIAHLA